MIYAQVGAKVVFDFGTRAPDGSGLTFSETSIDFESILINKFSALGAYVGQYGGANAVSGTKNAGGVTGCHLGVINTASVDDEGFFVAGCIYQAIAFITVDTKAVRLPALLFTLNNPPWIGTPAGASVSADIAAIPTAQGIWEYATRTLSDIDGITFISVMEAILAAVSGVAEPSGNTVIFKKRDGATAKITVTYGSEDGERTASTINS